MPDVAIREENATSSHVPPEPRRGPSLGSLGTEVILMIVDFLRNDDPKYLKTVALVSSLFSYAARYSAHRKVVFSLSKKSKSILRQKLDYIEKHRLFPAIRHVKFTKDGPESEIQALDPGLMSKLAGLTDLEWALSDDIPSWLLARLQGGKVRLHAGTGGFTSELSTGPLAAMGFVEYTGARRYVNCSNLHSLEARSHEWIMLRSALVKDVKNVLLSCPNLRKLAIDIGRKGPGLRDGEEPRTHGFGFPKGSPLPTLWELSVLKFDFGRQETGVVPDNGNVQNGWIDFEEQHWAEDFDWSQLKRLRTGNDKLARALAPHLTALEDVDLQECYGRISSVLRLIPAGLKSIVVNAAGWIDDVVIQRHGRTLQRLHIHNTTVFPPSPPKISLSTLTNLRDGCHKLRELAFDMPRTHGEWPWDMLKILSGFPCLRYLTIWFQLGMMGAAGDDSGVVRPFVTFSAAKMLFEYIRSQRSEALPQLLSLKILCGNLSDIEYQDFSPQTVWRSRNAVSFLCEMSERDDERAKGIYTVTCEGLSKTANKMLASGKAKGYESKLKGERLREYLLVRDGPRLDEGFARFAEDV